MKKLLFFAFLAAFGCQSAPESIPMCHDASAEFAALGSEKNFQNAHPTPKPVALLHGGTIVEFPVVDGPNGRGFLMTSHGRSNKYLLLFHEWWGLNNYVRNEANRLAHELGINVLALDLYDGKLTENAEEAGKLMQACSPERAAAIIKGAALYAGENADFRTLGWCFGGGWSLKASLLLGEQAKACVIYYGMPEKDVEKLKTLQTDVLMIHAKQDKWINDETVAAFQKNMDSAGKSLTVREYAADHAFANPSSPRFNNEAAQAARAAVLEYLRGK
ncbi:MAG: dienelactone hydrolase family protein [Saprospiraceae bacterium]